MLQGSENIWELWPLAILLLQAVFCEKAIFIHPKKNRKIDALRSTSTQLNKTSQTSKLSVPSYENRKQHPKVTGTVIFTSLCQSESSLAGWIKGIRFSLQILGNNFGLAALPPIYLRLTNNFAFRVQTQRDVWFHLTSLRFSPRQTGTGDREDSAFLPITWHLHGEMKEGANSNFFDFVLRKDHLDQQKVAERRLLASQSAPADFAQLWHFLHQEGNSSPLKPLNQTINSQPDLRTNKPSLNAGFLYGLQLEHGSSEFNCTHCNPEGSSRFKRKFTSCQWWSSPPSQGGKHMLKHSLISKLLLSEWHQSQHIFSALTSRRHLIQWLRVNLSTVLQQHGTTPYNPRNASKHTVVCWSLPSSPAEVSCFSRVLLGCSQVLDPWPLPWLLCKPVVTSHHGKPLPKRTTVNT